MKWYVPTSEQLMGMYLGANSLPSPLYDANNVSFVYADRANYHYATSDKKRIWSEEGASVGDYYVGNADAPQSFRCVRNLGIDKAKNDKLEKTEYPKQAFEYIAEGTRVSVYNNTLQGDEIITAKNIFKMSRLTDLNTRHTRYTKGEIAIHDNFDEGNAPYKHFKCPRISIQIPEKVVKKYMKEIHFLL